MYSEVEQKLIDLSEKIKKQELDFDWDLEEGLRNVSDQSLELAYEFLSRAEFSLSEKDEKIIITNNIVNLCNNTLTTDVLLKDIKEKSDLIRNSATFSISKKKSINFICHRCKLEKCPKHLSGYIYYLMCKDLLVDKLKDRQTYRETQPITEVFDFVWDFKDALRMVPDDVYDFCYEVVKRDLIYVGRNLEPDGRFPIISALSCYDFKNLFGDVSKLDNIDVPFSKWTVLRRFPNREIELCNSYSCGLNGCLFAICGIIYYLITNKEEYRLAEERDYYHLHKEEMDAKLQEKIKRKLNNMQEDIDNALNTINEYKDKITNFDSLLASLKNKNQSNFHCIIEGEDAKERSIIISNIVKFISQSRKLEDKKFIRCSLQNLTATYLTAIDEAKDKGLKSYKEIKKNKLRENVFYVVDGIDEFVNDFRVFKSVKIDSLHGEIRNKQYNHIIKLLTEISYSNYIILEGTPSDIDSFIELEPKLQYVYQDSRFKVSDFSLDEAFELYARQLENKLFTKYKENPDAIRKQFLEYVSLNKNFIPFSNRELASYLSLYSNTKGKIVFPDNIYKKETTEEALKNIIGLDNVKQKVKDFEKYMLFKIKAEAEGLKLVASNMHMIFTGNPGTGKTTVARIMAKMLYDMGIIRENKLIEVERKDLIGQYVGQTAPKTYEVIEKALGGVLFIDEAYTLANESKTDYGSEAIATLIKSMEDHKNDLVVIFAGYKNEMEKFMDINPGITSRIGYTFDFEDYTSDELVKIFYKKLQNMGFTCLEECDEALKKLCTYFSRRKDFGNGRFVDKLIQEVMLKHAINETDNIKNITLSDIPLISELNNVSNNNQSTDELLNGIIGLDSLKLKIKEFEEYIKFIKSAEKKGIKIPSQNMHMIFTGNPGTGKTTIARIMAQILFNTGIIEENKLIEVERKDLVGQYIGQTAPKTHEVIEKAMGGVLFIDEAYSLAGESKSDYGSEAISTLIKAMEDHKDELIVIFAGYKKEMGQFLDNNSGIASRIGYTFEFEDYDKDQLAQILYKKIGSSNLKLDENAKPKVLELMGYFCNVENIGNGRFVDRVYKETILKHAKNNPAKLDVISIDDIPTIKEITNTLYDGQNMINPENIDEHSLRKTAIHEIGHAIVRVLLYNEPDIIKITINAEGSGSLGYVRYKNKSSYVQTKSNLLNQIKVSMAGMAAEEEFLGEFANGNTSDLEKATKVAKNMVTRYGMSDLGYGQISMGGSFDVKVQEEINKILDECYKETKKIISSNKDKMNKLVEFLLDKKEITEDEFMSILNEEEIEVLQ